MNLDNLKQDVNTQAPLQEGFRIDVKRIIYRSLQYWYVIVLSLIIALAYSFFKTRYAVRIYPVTASFLIKQKEETSEGRLLYNNPLVSGFRNYLDEIYIIRSYPLIQRTLEDLNFGVAFYREGSVLTTEEYNCAVRAKVVNDRGVSNVRFYFKILDDNKFELREDGEVVGSKKSASFAFGDTITFEDIDLVFSMREGRSIKEMRGVFLFTYAKPASLTGAYVTRLRASWAEEGSGVLNLSIDGSDPIKEIDFLNGLIDHYQEYDLQKKILVASRTIDFISEQLTGIKDSLQDVERQLERFKNTNVMTSLSAEAERLYNKLEPLETQRVRLIISGNYLKYLSEYITKGGDKLDQAILPSSVGIEDKILSDLVSQMIDLQMRLKMNTKAENPLIDGGKKRIVEIKHDILEAIKNQRSTDKIAQDYLDKQIHDIEKQLSYLPQAERRLVSIQRNYSLLENLYIFLLQKRAEAGISRASTTTDISIVNPSMITGGPISPKPLNNYLIAIILGLGFPLGLFVLLEVFNTKVQSKEDVEKVTSIPFIGGVGHKSGENNLEVLKSPKSSIAESFRALRSNLTYFLGTREKAVFMVTSSISGEGKTFTSVNLASVFALSGKRTLIVGADMRKPKIFYDFGLSNDLGLSNYLAGLNNFDQIVQATDHACLDMISGGPVPPNPSELLLAQKMDKFLEEAKSRYDYIIIDTPPLAIVTDAFVLARHADHTLFLVRQNYTPKALLRTANDFYASGKLQNISIVLNDIYRSGPGYGYGYGYSYGYGYGYGYSYGSRKSQKNGYGYYAE